MKQYRTDIDVLKGLAIIVVVLYHSGILKTGYLGVDIFLTINGFLVLPRICTNIYEKSYSYVQDIRKRINRLAPLIIISSFVCLCIGAISMLPDDYENLSQSVIASNFFSENILSAITTKDYWDTNNDYKPLMHLWYVGILMQFYVLIPILVKFGYKLLEYKKLGFKKTTNILLLCLFFLSFALYFFGCKTPGDRFYYIPFRIFEFIGGGIVAINLNNHGYKNQNILTSASFIILMIVLLQSIPSTDFSNLGTNMK